MRNCIKALVFSLFLSIPCSSFGWGMIGHRVIGKIAYSYLKPKTKLAIREILGNETLALSTTWADFIRSDSNFNYLAKWHYINFPTGLDYKGFSEILKKDTAADAYTRIQLCIHELKKKGMSLEKKRLYLRMLVHVLGDIHMPFHAGREEDKGGNSYMVQWTGQPTNMHRLWDEQIINFQQLSYTEYADAINFSTPKQRLEWVNGGLNSWLFGSYQIVEKLYAEKIETNQKLGYDYNFKHIDTLNSQLLKAGIRLASVLNEIFQ